MARAFLLRTTPNNCGNEEVMTQDENQPKIVSYLS
ncbi:hypothetical protein PMI22_04025 [Pseudomonas sp. GM21]|nr:hypothetical protein PMI22_04025 [Pseudomonas sp. GM21]